MRRLSSPCGTCSARPPSVQAGGGIRPAPRRIASASTTARTCRCSARSTSVPPRLHLFPRQKHSDKLADEFRRGLACKQRYTRRLQLGWSGVNLQKNWFGSLVVQVGAGVGSWKLHLELSP